MTDTRATYLALAEGYAWGRQDERVHSAGVGYERDTAAATAFAQAFAAHRAAFLDGKLGMAHNVGTAYDMFVRGETLPVETVKRPWQADCEYCQRYSRACGRHDV